MKVHASDPLASSLRLHFFADLSFLPSVSYTGEILFMAYYSLLLVCLGASPPCYLAALTPPVFQLGIQQFSLLYDSTLSPFFLYGSRGFTKASQRPGYYLLRGA